MALTDALAAATTDEERNTAILRMTQQEQTASHLQSAGSLEELLLKCAESKRLVDADQMWAYALEDMELVSKAIDGDAVAEVRVPAVGTSLLGHVALTGQVVNVLNVYDDVELAALSPEIVFDKSGDAEAGYVTKSILLAPIVNKGSVTGVVQAINKLTSDSFNFLDEETLKDLGRGLGAVLGQLKQYEAQQAELQYQERLNTLINRIHSARDVDQLLLGLKADMLDLLGAERLTIYAVDAETNELFSRIKEGDEVHEFRVPIDTSSVAGYVAATRVTVNIRDAYDDDELASIHHELRFNRSFDAQTGFRTGEILATPVQFEGNLVGAVQILNSTTPGGFDDEDVQRVEEVAKTLGIAFSNQARAGVKRTKFDALVKKGLIKAEDVETAREKAREDGTSLDQALMEEFRISKEEMLAAFAEYFGAETFVFDQNMAIPQAVIASNKLESQYDHLKYAHWVPIDEEDGVVTVAVDDPKDIQKRDLIQAQLPNKRLRYLVALPDDISDAIDLFFGVGGDIEGVDELIGELSEIETGLALDDEMEEATEDDNAIVKIVNRIIEEAYRRGASDIHIEPYLEKDTVIRYRVDGSMLVAMTLPRQYRNAILSRIKIMSELDIAERRNPQSGKIKFRRWGKLDIELRVETCPTAGPAEDCVMRILASNKPMPLDSMGLSERNYSEFIKIISQPYGICLVVGPTGSGKTTTLHSALGFINKEDTKIWTAEDPVEITQAGLRQVQINKKAGLDFSSAMRSFLRADPDVIMVGEMRDLETTSTGIEASLTGHLVFSTLHTNSAPETVTRLLEMGIDEYNFADALLGVLAQRLCRTLCKSCKEEYHPEREEFDTLRQEYGAEDFDATDIDYSDDLLLFKAKEGGCAKCGGVGFKGRMGIYELMVSSDSVKSLIYSRAKADELRSAAMSEGMSTLKQDGIQKAFAGLTTIGQIRSVCSR